MLFYCRDSRGSLLYHVFGIFFEHSWVTNSYVFWRGLIFAVG